MIRQANISDLDQLARLLDLYRQFYKQESNIPAAKAYLEDRFKNQESAIFVALPDNDDDRLVGFVQLYPSFSSIGLATSWILNDLFIENNQRGNGYGEELMKVAMTFSKNSGARNLMLQTSRMNENAQKLYEKLGWEKDNEYFTYYFFH